MTRIKNNQITDLTVNAASKLQDYSITSGKIANNLTYGSDLTVTGNLTVQGNVTAIDTIDLVVEDPLILLAKEQTGSPTLDIGFVGKRGTEDNIAFVWDESEGQFVTVFTSSEITNTTISINSYASLRVLDITAANADITGNVTFSGNIVGDLGVTGNVNAGNINSNAAVTGVTITASGNLEGNNAVITGDVSAATATITGNVDAGNLNSVAAVTGVTITASGNLEGNNAVITGDVSAATGSFTGNVDAGNINSNAAVTGVTITASGNLVGNNAVITGDVSAATATITGNVDAGNINSNAAVTGVTITASGNLEGNNAVITGDVSAATGTFTGNVDAGNINSNAAVTGVTITASGNLVGNNAVITGDVSTTTVTATGNITADYFIGNGSQLTGIDVTRIENGNSNVKIDTANGNVTVSVTGTSNVVVFTPTSVEVDGEINASGNVLAANINANGTITGASATITGNVDSGNVNTTGVYAATGDYTGNVVAGNITSNADITGVTVTATGNLVGGNANITDGVFATDVTATGNVNGGNVNTDKIFGNELTITAGNVLFEMTGNIDLGQRWINDLADPIQAFDAATKQYVDDAVSSGITIHEPVQLLGAGPSYDGTYAQGGTTYTVTEVVSDDTVVFSTAAGLSVNDQLWFTTSFNGIEANKAYFVVATPNASSAILSTTYNGVAIDTLTDGTGLTEEVRVNSGQGATLTNNGTNAALVIDGVEAVVGYRVLLETQTDATTNGVYVVTVVGDESTPWVLTRSNDMNTYIPDNINGLDAGDYFFVELGDSKAGEAHVMTAPTGPVIIGYDLLVFTLFASSSIYSAGNGLSLTGTVFSVNVDNDTTAIVADNVVVKAGANLVTPNIGDATGNSLTLSGNGLLSATTVTATGNISGSNLVASNGMFSTTVSASGNLVAGNITSNASIDGVTITASGNLVGNNAVITGDVSAATGSFTGNVDAGNLNSSAAVTGVTITASGNLVGNNAVITGDVSATTASFSGNVDAGNLVTLGNVDGGVGYFTGNVTADTFFGNFAGNVQAGGSNTQIQFNDDSILNGSAAFTFDSTSNLVTVSGNVDAGNLTTAGDVSAATATITGNVAAGNVNSNAAVTGVTITASGNLVGNNAVITGDVSTTTVTATGNVDGGNINTAGQVVAIGNITGGNIISQADVTTVSVTATGNITGGNIETLGQANLGNIRISGDTITGTNGQVLINSAGEDVNFVVSGDEIANLFIVDAGSDTVLVKTSDPTTGVSLKIGSTDSILVPVGTSGERPVTPVTGMVRFNTTIDALEFYDADSWTIAGAEFTVIVADEFVGDNSTVAFTLSEPSTTATTLVAINGVLQIPTTAYSVSGTTLTFTEAPESTDVIDARILTTTTTVTGISNATNTAAVETPPGGDVQLTGNLVPTANVTYDLGSDSQRWNDLYLAGDSIILGNVIIKNTTGNIIGFFGSDGTTPAAIDTNNIDSAAISNGTSNVSVISSNGNVDVNINGSPIVTFFSGGIDNRQANGVGNIGTATSYFNTVFAKATSAQYADLAEMYEADMPIESGTVVCFGGEKEVTTCLADACRRVAGVVSTNPSYLMNSGQKGEYVVAVALQGRVPVKVTGVVRKGDMMVSTGDGRARAESDPTVGAVIGKALADFDGQEGVIEVVIGRV